MDTARLAQPTKTSQGVHTMANSAAVVFVSSNSAGQFDAISPVVRLQWNGGADSVYAFLDAMNRYEDANLRVEHQAMNFARIAANYIGDWHTVSLFNAPSGEITAKTLANINLDTNHGLYVVSKNSVMHFTNGAWLFPKDVNAEREAALKLAYSTNESDGLNAGIAYHIDEANIDFFPKAKRAKAA